MRFLLEDGNGGLKPSTAVFMGFHAITKRPCPVFFCSYLFTFRPVKGFPPKVVKRIEFRNSLRCR